MKTFILSLILIAGGWYLYETDRFFPDLMQSFNREGLLKHYSPIEDSKGRTIHCKVIAKNEDFIIIERESDQQSFLLNTYTLSRSSRRKVDALSDFNTSAVEDRLFTEALGTVRVELEYVPALTYLRCHRTNLRQKSCEGIEVDRFRAFLRAQGVPYRETTPDETRRRRLRLSARRREKRARDSRGQRTYLYNQRAPAENSDRKRLLDSIHGYKPLDSDARRSPTQAYCTEGKAAHSRAR